MKLYGTITSERATKGQGGNEFVCAEFNVNREIVGQVELYLYNDKKNGCNEDEWVLKFRKGGDDEDNDWDILAQGNISNEQKAKKQKGEVCSNCGKIAKTLYQDRDDDGFYVCENCI